MEKLVFLLIKMKIKEIGLDFIFTNEIKNLFKFPKLILVDLIFVE